MMKVALIGAGSAVFAQRMITDILAIDGLDSGTFAMVDLDTERLELAHEVAEQTVQSAGKPWTVQATTERRNVLSGCDYVINMIEVGGLANVYSDYAIPLKYGVDQCIADTIGPGGVFKYLRTAPSWLAICRDIEELCPRALVINYSNPMSALMLTALRSTSLQVIGLCQSVVQTSYELADYMEVPFERMRYRCAGINHLSWFVKLEMDDEDLYPRLRSAAEDPAMYEQDPIRFDLMRAFGYFTTESSGHVSEYVPYFRKRKDLIEFYISMRKDLRGGERASRWPVDRAEHDERLRDYLERERRGERAFYLDRSLDAGSYMIEGHALNQPQLIYGNVRNNGLIENLPRNGCVEIACMVDGNGIQPVPFGNLPTQLAALDSAHMMIHELMVQALLNEDREAAVQALLLDPLTAAVCSLTEVRQMFDEMAATQQAYLPLFINPTEGAHMADIIPYLERIRARFEQPETRSAFQGFARTIQFMFTDLHRNFALSIAQDGNAILTEETVPQPDIKVTTSSDILAGILDRTVNPELAFITRKLKASGSMEDLLKLQKLL